MLIFKIMIINFTSLYIFFCFKISYWRKYFSFTVFIPHKVFIPRERTLTFQFYRTSILDTSNSISDTHRI